MFQSSTILYVLLVAVAHSLKVALYTCNQTQPVYPTSKQYNSASCQCLPTFDICQPQITIIFSDLQLNESLYYEYAEPLFIDNVTINSTSMNKTLPVGFVDLGTEAMIYLQYQSQHVQLHFNFVNSTKKADQNKHLPFDLSFIILSLLVVVMQLFVTSPLKTHLLDAISIQWWFFIVYAVVFAGFILILDMTQGVAVKYIQYVVIGLVSMASAYFMIVELLSGLGMTGKVGRIKVKMIIAFFMMLLVGFLRVILGNTWYLNDLFAVLIVASVLKIFRIRSLRASLFFIISTTFLNIGLELGFILSGSKVGLRLINEYPSPLEIQLPTLSYFAFKRCSWVTITDILFSGFIISYCRRLDSAFRVCIYFFVAFVSVLMAFVLQVTVYILTEHQVQLPQSLFSVMFIVCMLSLVATRRGQWPTVWFGNFYDPTEESVNFTRSIEWNNLTHDMDRSLMVE